MGENIGVKKIGNEYVLQGNPSPSEIKRNKNNRLKITLSNFKLQFLADSITTNISTSTDLKPETVVISNYVNKNTLPASVSKKILYTESSKTAISTTHKIANEVGVGFAYEVNVPLIAKTKTEAKFKLSHEYSFGNQKETLNSKEITDWTKFPIPPETRATVSLIYNKSKESIPFEALAEVFFNVKIEGIISTDPLLYTNKQDIKSDNNGRKILSYTFGNNDISAIEDMKRQIGRKDLPNGSPWNWNLIMTLIDRNLASSYVPYVFDGIVTKFNGTLNQVNTHNFIVDISEEDIN